jgi:hypothetical protein
MSYPNPKIQKYYATNQPTAMALTEFLEEHLQGYYRSDDIARLDDLSKLLSHEMGVIEKRAKGLHTTLYGEAFKEFLQLQDKLFEEAVNAYTVEVLGAGMDMANNT